jgi:ribosomal protein S18 acetylase RimI-like enzyme
MALGRVNLLGRSGRLLQGLQHVLPERRRDTLSSLDPDRVLVRDAQIRDCTVVAEMANDLARITSGKDGGMTAHRVERDLLSGSGLSLIVGEMSSQVRGYALYSVAYDTAHGGRGLYLSDLFVDAAARRRGVARALMAELAWRCQKDGGGFIWWIVMPGNPGAERFYASLGAAVDPPKAMAVYGRAFDALLHRHATHHSQP